MNIKLLEAILGRLLTAYGFILAVPLAIALFYREEAYFSFLLTMVISFALGFFLYLRGRIEGKIRIREGFAAVAGVWVLASLFAALPFYISGVVPTYIDAVFEAISGLTTTGASVIDVLETLPRSILFWRSLTHWLGGMGIIVMFIVLLPNIGIGAVHLFNAEVPGPITEKVFPKIKDTALVLWMIYTGFTLICFLFLWAAGMPLFDSVNHALSTMASGGFSTRTASIAAYKSVAIELILIFFMILAGSNFNLFVYAWRHRTWRPFKDPEFKFYIYLILIASVVITLSLIWQNGFGLFSALRYSLFQVVTVITTTGFASTDYDQWPGLAKLVLFLLMFIGGCSGSTAGGLKVSRILLLFKMGWAQIKQAIHPRLVVSISVQNQVVNPNILSAVGGFFFLYISIFGIGSLLVAATGLETFEAMSAVAATLGNGGPGFGIIGPMLNYGSLSEFAKIILSLCMLLGRLELFTLLVFLQPAFWKPKKSW